MTALLETVRRDYTVRNRKDPDEAKRELEQAQRALDSLLPIEAEMRGALTKRIKDLRASAENPFDQRYDRIDLRFLTRRRRQSLLGWQRAAPAFACFEPHKEGGDVCSIQGSRHSSSEDRVNVLVTPHVVTEYYEDVANNIVLNRASKIIKCRISCRFAGAIPAKGRELIKRGTDEFDGKLLLVTEAPRWKVDLEVQEPPPDPDPLVVGYKDGVAWLLGHFDLTSAEAAIKAEFCTTKE